MKKKFDISKFEALAASGEKLKGGFSSAFKTATTKSVGGNNCFGGNCAAGCSIKDIPTTTN